MAAGVITKVLPWETECSILRKLNDPRSGYLEAITSPDDLAEWCNYIYDDKKSILDVPHDTQFCKLLRAGMNDPLVILLMALLPNMRDIHLNAAPFHPHALPWHAFGHRFRALKNFTAGTWAGYQAWPLTSLQHLIQGGSLQKLQLHKAGGGWRVTDFDDWIPEPFLLAPNSTNITQLLLQCCTFSKEEMKIILNACAPLRTLYYSTGGKWTAPENFSMANLVELLQPHKDSLTDLFLDMYTWWGWWDFDDELDDLPSLQDFTVLKKIDTSIHTWSEILLPDDIKTIDFRSPVTKDTKRLCDLLPPSLEHCILVTNSLYGKTWLDVRQVMLLVTARIQGLSNLNRLTIVGLEECEEVVQTYFLHLQEHMKTKEPRFSLEFLTELQYLHQDHTFFKWINKKPSKKLAQHWKPTFEIQWNGNMYTSKARQPPIDFEEQVLLAGALARV